MDALEDGVGDPLLTPADVAEGEDAGGERIRRDIGRPTDGVGQPGG
jgi:hypothetical protein